MRRVQKILLTGHEGFIGSHVYLLLKSKGFEVVGIDAETYAARPSFLNQHDGRWAYNTHKEDIRNDVAIESIVMGEKPDAIIHLAAESHVCNSIKGPRVFMETNIMGTFNLLEAIRNYCPEAIFIHVSTDEVFGELPLDRPELKFNNNSPIDPRSPYSASKASSDMIVQAYHHTYGIKTLITNCSNNYGPNQHEEKLIPRTIQKILNQEKPTIYLPGNQVRDWLYVEDHAQALLTVLEKGEFGERYLIGGDQEKENIEIVKIITSIMRDKFKISWPVEYHYTDGRPTDDLRYAIDTRKIKSLGWNQSVDLYTGLEKTIAWYMKEFNK